MCSDSLVSIAPDSLPDDIETLRAALVAERAALIAERAVRREFEVRASGAEAMVAHLKLLIAKMKRDRFGASAERSRKLLDQLEMELEELETTAAENEASADGAAPEQVSVRPRQASARSTSGTFAARAGSLAITHKLPVLRWQVGEAWRGHHRKPGERSA
jgi:transposase